MRLTAEILFVRIALAALAPGEWGFWCFAAWRARLRTHLDNLNARRASRRKKERRK